MVFLSNLIIVARIGYVFKEIVQRPSGLFAFVALDSFMVLGKDKKIAMIRPIFFFYLLSRRFAALFGRRPIIKRTIQASMKIRPAKRTFVPPTDHSP
jgi:hypothetical protein